MTNQINELMVSIQDCLTILINDSTEIAMDFQAGNTSGATNKLIGYIEDFSCLVEAIDIVQNENVNIVAKLDAIKLRNVLLEMEQAMCNKDHVLLADILEYEIKEVLIEIQSCLEA
jgi:hypothetical protein